MDWSTIVIVAIIVVVPHALQRIASSRDADKLVDAVHEVHASLNSRLSELLETTANASRMEGVEQERRESRARDAARDP